jgi:hypothetical protein
MEHSRRAADDGHHLGAGVVDESDERPRHRRTIRRDKATSQFLSLGGIRDQSEGREEEQGGEPEEGKELVPGRAPGRRSAGPVRSMMSCHDILSLNATVPIYT